MSNIEALYAEATMLVETLEFLAIEGQAAPESARGELRETYREARARLRVIRTQVGDCVECGQPAGSCYRLCSGSVHYYSPEAEREDSLYQDSMSQGEWHSAAAAQYEAAHGHPYCD